MKKSIFTTSLLSFIILTFSIPATSTVELGERGNTPPSNDPMVGYQWYLFNNGQKVRTDLDDIHSAQVGATTPLSLGWKNFDAEMTKDPVVAIIDSGLDTAHPELKGRILPGKSFADSDVNHDTLVDDDFGHGTHLAGVVAAQMGNAEGVLGLSNRVKILPLKVYDSAEVRGARRAKTHIVTRIKRAVDFAVQSGADVINFSLGWPRVENNSEIQATIENAIQAGVVVVAAAGNDHHERQIYPCAYVGVICVGAYGIEGSATRITNTGGHVDLLAPGQMILSLFPLMKPSFLFGVKGYEYKSGSSQAAVIVSGASAILKGLFPSESGVQIRSRLLGSALVTKSKEPVLYGKLDILAAAKYSDSLVAPIFKGVDQVIVDSVKRSFQFPLRFEQHGMQTSTLQKPRLRSLSKGVSLELKQNPDGSYFGEGQLSTWQVNNRLTYEIVIDSRRFEHSVVLTRRIDSLKTEQFEMKSEEVLNLADIQSVTRLGLPGNQTYWATTLTSNKQLKLIKWHHGKEVSHIFNDISASLRGFDLTEWGDGSEYLFTGTKPDETGQPKSVHFFYLDSNLNVLRTLELQYEGVLPSSVQEISKSELAIGNYSGLKVPVFRDHGLIPKGDLNPDYFANAKNVEERRIYYFEPKENNFVTRTLTAPVFAKYLRANIGPRVDALAILPQSIQDKKSGLIKLLLYEGVGIRGTHYIAEISDLKNWHENIRIVRLDTGTNNLVRNHRASAWSTGKGLDTVPDLQGLFSEVTARSVVLSEQGLQVNRLTVPSLPEKIGGIIKTFVQGQNSLTFFETSEFARAQGSWKGQRIDSKFSIPSSTFLPGFDFRQTAMPVLVGDLQKPGILVDESAIFSRTVTLFTLEGQGIRSTAGNTFALPGNCQNKNPGIGVNGRSVLTFMCKEPNSVKIIHYGL
ncbi:MAG: S8 family serine peptidase [Bdellovibrionaceae bacterium]|nr:S8 family serine peptidase [Pseudobdellovibrionaceae bacterium]